MVAYTGRHVRPNPARRAMLALAILLGIFAIGYAGYSVGHANASHPVSACAHPRVLAPAPAHTHQGLPRQPAQAHHLTPHERYLAHLHHLSHLAHVRYLQHVRHLAHLHHLAHELHLHELE